jgi:nucleoside-diphosphate-sugar epimerase
MASNTGIQAYRTIADARRDQRQEVQPLVAVVVGGAGFTGQHLVRKLLAGLKQPFCEAYAQVRVVDVQLLPSDLLEDARIRFFLCPVGTSPGSTASPAVLIEAFSGASVCFYVASTDSRTLSRQRAWETNVNGALQCLDLAQQLGLRAYVYTSSHNVVCDFRSPIRAADEETARIPARHRDVYSASKAAAEQALLAKDSPGKVRICAIRPVGIYGPGEQVHFHRLFQLSKYLGMQRIETTPHDPHCMDWVHVESVAEAELLAATALMDPVRQYLVAGKAFFITDDGGPTSVQRIFDPVLEAAGIRMPLKRIHVHWRLLYTLAACFEFIAWILDDKPVLMKMEILKAHVAHTFRADAARRILGYTPRYTTSEGVQAWAKQMRHSQPGRLFETEPVEIRRLGRQLIAFFAIGVVLMALVFTRIS